MYQEFNHKGFYDFQKGRKVRMLQIYWLTNPWCTSCLLCVLRGWIFRKKCLL